MRYDFVSHTDEHIKGFKEDYAFLSNMQPCVIQWHGLLFMSTEAAYQASKTKQLSIAKQFQTLSGLEAKRHSKTIYVRKDWQDIRVSVMAQLIFQKFFNDLDLREKLLETGDRYIEETNNWKDTFWGVCNGVGENNLGKILMATRAYFKTYAQD